MRRLEGLPGAFILESDAEARIAEQVVRESKPGTSGIRDSPQDIIPELKHRIAMQKKMQ